MLNFPDSHPHNLSVIIHGSRGSIAIDGEEFKEHGGNSPCVEVIAGNRHVVFDAGTGLTQFAKQLRADIKASGKNELPYDIDICFTHLHEDHIAGLSLFLVEFMRQASGEHSIHFHAAQHQCGNDFFDKLADHIQPPWFPVPLAKMIPANKDPHELFQAFHAGDTLNLGEGDNAVVVKTLPINHGSETAAAYRLEYNNKSFALVTDYEHQMMDSQPQKDLPLNAFLRGDDQRGVDLMVYDAMYDDADLCKHYTEGGRAGIGHSSWQQAIRTMKDTAAKQLLLFHHAPTATDQMLEARQEKAENYYKELFPQTSRVQEHTPVNHAKDGMRIELGPEREQNTKPSNSLSH